MAKKYISRCRKNGSSFSPACTRRADTSQSRVRDSRRESLASLRYETLRHESGEDEKCVDESDFLRHDERCADPLITGRPSAGSLSD